MKKLILLALLVSGTASAYTLKCDEGRTINFQLENGDIAITAEGKTLRLPVAEMNDMVALYHGQAADGSGGMFMLNKQSGVTASIYIRGNGNAYHCRKPLSK
ncbi:hypothetical protein [Pseudescherichia sp.]|uniref:hypothetical protein n=1 Tax=Pseudescherichia sp. TaxID=2055881 RepID=UPI0028A87F39|nr:hypothetical protein [Pseudescherichia sp.]